MNRQLIKKLSLNNASSSRFIGCDTTVFERGFRHPMSANVFQPPNRNLVDTYEGANKHTWIDIEKDWCELCQEPVGSSFGIHLGDRDHICLGLFVHLFAHFPRSWNTHKVLLNNNGFDSPHRRMASLVQTFKSHGSIDQLHTVDDAARRAETEAILLHLTRPPHHAVKCSLQGNTPLQFWVPGERIFKNNVARLITKLFPPMSPGTLTTFCQKCWGRSNMERMYDALNIAILHEHYGVTPKEGRDKKAFFMRSMMCELEIAHVDASLDPVTLYLIETVKQRVSFELIFLQSMIYMNRVQEVMEKLDYPSERWLLMTASLT